MALTKEVTLGGLATLGAGGTAGYGIYVYTRPGTIGHRLFEERKIIVPVSDNLENRYQNLWKHIVSEYKTNSSSKKTFSGITINGDDASIKVLKDECKKTIDTIYSDSVSELYEIASTWCVVPDTLEANWILNDKPTISLVSESDREEYWKKAYDNFFLRVEETDSIDGLENKTNGRHSSNKYEKDSKYSKLKSGCETLLKKPRNSSDKDKSKWCLQFRTTKEALSNKELKGETDSEWATKYSSATSSTADADIKKTLEGLKESGDSDGKKAMKKWCEIALNADESYKDKVSSNCVFK